MNSDDKLLQILDNSACLRKGQITGYLKGSLYPEELRVVELHLSECSLCNDALEGLQLVSQPETAIDRLVLPELPQATVPERKTTAAAEISASKRPEAKVNTIERGPSYSTQKFSRPRNYSWVGGVGIAALLLLGSVLIWQFELRNTNNLPDLTGSNASFPVDPVPDSGMSNEKRAAEQIASAGIKKENIAIRDSVPVAQLKRDSMQKEAAPVAYEEKTAAGKDSASASSLPAGTTDPDPEDHTIAMNAKSRSEQTDVKQAPADTKADRPPRAPAGQQEAPPATTGEISDFDTGLRLFKQKKYASALLYLKSAESDNEHPKHWAAVYYSALCNRYLGKTGRARRLFKKVVSAGAPQKSSAEKQLKEMANAGENK